MTPLMMTCMTTAPELLSNVIQVTVLCNQTADGCAHSWSIASMLVICCHQPCSV